MTHNGRRYSGTQHQQQRQQLAAGVIGVSHQRPHISVPPEAV